MHYSFRLYVFWTMINTCSHKKKKLLLLFLIIGSVMFLIFDFFTLEKYYIIFIWVFVGHYGNLYVPIIKNVIYRCIKMRSKPILGGGEIYNVFVFRVSFQTFQTIIRLLQSSLLLKYFNVEWF